MPQMEYTRPMRLQNQRGVTVFFSSHILGEVQRMCSRVAIIKEGKIIEVADIRTLQKNNYKKVQLMGERIDPAGFDLPGVTHLEHQGDSVHFFFKGDINLILQKISSIKVSDVTIEEPTLEEIFLHYYE